MAVVLGLPMLAAACTATPSTQTQPETSEPTPTVTAPSTTEANGDWEAPPTDTAVPAPDRQTQVPLAMASRTADAAGPFGQPDLWIGAGPPATGLQRSLGAGDVAGPLLSFGGTAPGAEYSVRDTCDLPDLLAKAEAAGAAFWLNPWLADRLERCTSLHRFEVTHGTSSRNWRYFATRADAEQWITRQKNDTVRMTALPTDTSPFGVMSSHSPFGIMLAPFDAPVDEVRVLPDTVAVSGGVLRGLVRNRSRHLWAYEVTVSAGGRSFSWPLSVQPGEIAPFEIGGWDRPADPEQIEFDIHADMSWHADPSRALWSEFDSPDLGVPAGSSMQLSAGVRERYRNVTADVAADAPRTLNVFWHSLQYASPRSHLSWAQDIESLVVEDLRGYGAVLDGHGGVVDVGPMSVYAWVWDEQSGRYSREDATGWPYGDPGTHDMFVNFDIYAELPYDGRDWGEPGGQFSAAVRYSGRDDGIEWGTLHGGYIIWIGAAHPERAVR